MTVQLTQEQFQELLGRVSGMNTTRPNNFADCNLSFRGQRDYHKVDEFIKAITAYKQQERISDEDALISLPLILKEAASVWWTDVCSEIATWTEALNRIRSEFSPKPKPHEVYAQLFAKPQGENEPIETFLIMKRLLLEMLPPGRHSEEAELDMIYGQLRPDSRKELARSDVTTFADLLHKVRRIEALKKVELITNIRRPQPATRTIKKRLRCSFCRLFGHTSEICRKRLVQLAHKINNGEVDSFSSIGLPPTYNIESPITFSHEDIAPSMSPTPVISLADVTSSMLPNPTPTPESPVALDFICVSGPTIWTNI